MTETTWRNRVVARADVDPNDLASHPQNWRIHAPDQRSAMGGVLDEIGWVSSVLVSQATDTILDGHMRVGLALERGEPTVPVDYVDVTPEEEIAILSTLDPIKTLAGVDPALLQDLRAGLLGRNPALAALAGWQERDQDRDDMTRDHTSIFMEDEEGEDGDDIFAPPVRDDNPYMALAVRQLQFVMDIDMYERSLDVFDRVIEAEGLETNADVVLWLIERYAQEPA